MLRCLRAAATAISMERRPGKRLLRLTDDMTAVVEVLARLMSSPADMTESVWVDRYPKAMSISCRGFECVARLLGEKPGERGRLSSAGLRVWIPLGAVEDSR